MSGRSMPGTSGRARGGLLPTGLLLAAAVAQWGGAARAAVPPPGQTPAKVIVSGRTSTAADVTVVNVGTQIPETYSGSRLKNTPGFTWYVSRHYAFKTDYPEKKARFYLTLLEMAWPHYVELFGREPDGIETRRMAVVYGSSAAQLDKALRSDGIRWDFNGGGITFEGYRCAYQFPSGTLQYHQRYILLHECAHLFQMCLNGTIYTTRDWYYEGVADALSHHVYEQDRRRLTVGVYDKPTTNDFLDAGLRAAREQPRTFQDLHDKGAAPRGMNYLMVHFLLQDPDRAQRFRVWRDEMFRLAPRDKKIDVDSARLLTGLLGPWDKINADFQAWLSRQHSTFHYAEWGWEQDGDTLWSYGFAPGGRLSQTDVHLIPSDKPTYDPFRMDYPAGAMPQIVGPVERGLAEPAVGCVVDFSRCPGRGCAGMGLALVAGGGVKEFDEADLFVDRAATKPGLEVTAWRLARLRGEGTSPTDAVAGQQIGKAVEPGIRLGDKGSPTEGLKDNFVAEWDGWLRIREAGAYEPGTVSDDGSWLWIDGRVVADNGGAHGDVAAYGEVKLTAGMHRLRVRYFQGGGGLKLAAGWAPQPRPGFVQVLLYGHRELVIDGGSIGMAKTTTAITPALRGAMAAGGHRVGVTCRIGRAALDVTLRARDPKAASPVEMKVSLPVTAEQRQALLSRPGTLLSRDGWHGVTPYFDDRRRGEPDLAQPAPPNRWRNPGDHQLAALYKAAWRLGTHAPPSLTALKTLMLAAVTAAPAVQQAALATFGKQIAAVQADIRKCAAPPDRTAAALADLGDVPEPVGISPGDGP